MAIKVKSHGGEIGFYEWNLNTMENFQDFIKACFKEACEHAQKEPLYVSISPRLDEPMPPPTTLYVSLPIGFHDMDGLDFYVDLEDVINDYIERHSFADAEQIELTHAKALSAKLRKLADKIDTAVKDQSNERR